MVACWRQIATLPLDTAKVRLQLQAKSDGIPKYKCARLRLPCNALRYPRTTAEPFATVCAGACWALSGQLRRRRALARCGTAWKQVGQHCREPRSACALEPRLADSRPRAGLHRQFLFGGLRIGLYEPVKRLYMGEKAAGEAPLYLKIAAGLTTGALAIMVANPADLVKVPPRACGHCPVAGRCAFSLEARLEGRGSCKLFFLKAAAEGRS